MAQKTPSGIREMLGASITFFFPNAPGNKSYIAKSIARGPSASYLSMFTGRDHESRLKIVNGVPSPREE